MFTPGTSCAEKALVMCKTEDTAWRGLKAEDSRANRQGFTLAEVLISFALVTIMITATAQLTMRSLFVQRRAESSLRSAELASSKLEYLKSLPYESPELKEGSWEESLKEEGALMTFRREWIISDILPGLKRIEIKCFSESLPQKKARLVLFLSRELGF